MIESWKAAITIFLNQTHRKLTRELWGYKLDVAMITESNLKPQHWQFGHNNWINTTRQEGGGGRRGGGVAIYISTSLQASEWICKQSNILYESLWVRVSDDINKTIIGVLYHPPKPIYVSAAEPWRMHRSDCIIISIVLAGDMNTLPEHDIMDSTGYYGRDVAYTDCGWTNTWIKQARQNLCLKSDMLFIFTIG